MLNVIWPAFVLISYIYAVFSGNLEELNSGIFDSCSSAVELTITFFGTITLWCGIMRIAKDSSLPKKLSKLLSPLICFLFPDVKKGSSAYNNISLNIVANMLGLGNAATPLGLNAMQSLQQENHSKNTLSNSMVMLILINTASLQIIPTTVIAIRNSLNSTNSTAMLVPVWLSTILAAIAGVLAVKFFIKIGK